MEQQLPPDFDLEKDGNTICHFNDAPTIRSAVKFQRNLNSEITAAGGIDAWRATQNNKQPHKIDN